jgi:protein ImuB
MESSRRILSVWLPLLPTDRLKRRWPDRLDKRPLVIAGKIDNALQLTAVDEMAARLGLHPGKALADARAMIPDITVIRANERADAKLLEAIADWCERYSPLVALDLPHGLFLDVSGCAHLYSDETAMLKQVNRTILAQGFSARVALAGTAESSRALAHYRPGTIIPSGREAEVIAPLPTEAIAADPLIIHALKRAGLKTIGQVAQRTRRELAARFGGAFVSLLDRTLGRGGHPITPRTPLPEIMAEHRFAEPVVTEAIIAETLKTLAQSLASILEKRGQGARVLEASFFHVDGQTRRIAIEMGQATRDPKIVCRLFREKLDVLADPLDPGFGFDLIRLAATLIQTLETSATILGANVHDTEIALLTDKLAARFGGHRVMRFLQQDTHIPEAAAVCVPAQHYEVSKLPWKPIRMPTESPLRPLRLFAKPEPVEMIPEVPDDAPLRFRWRRALHTVVHIEGPERLAMEWWRHQEPQPTRDYFRIEDENGNRFWLYRDGIAREIAQPRWYVHGLFA